MDLHVDQNSKLTTHREQGLVTYRSSFITTPQSGFAVGAGPVKRLGEPPPGGGGVSLKKEQGW